MFKHRFVAAFSFVFAALLTPLPGSAATPQLSVTQITRGGVVIARAGDVTLRNLAGDVVRRGLQTHDALPREVQVDVPAGDTIVVSVAQRSKTSTATLMAGSRSTFWNTGTIEMVAVRGGKVDFDDPLSFFRVSAQSVTLSHHLTKFSVDVEGGRTSVACTQDSVNVSLGATKPVGMRQSLGFSSRIDTVTAGPASSVVYRGNDGDMHGDVPFAQDLAAATTGNPQAEYNVAVRLEHGNGVSKNTSAAMRYYRLSAAKRFPAAENYLGYLYSFTTSERHANYSLARELLTRAAAAGDADGQANLGYLYYDGLGVAKSGRRAVALWRAGAAQGGVDAENNLGVAYQEGNGVARDYHEAMYWYALAAAQGAATALNNIGYLYQHGLGVEHDYKKAFSLYRRAAERGDEFGENNLGTMYQGGLGTPVDYAAAMMWYRKAAAHGIAAVGAAENNIGNLYDNGEGVPRDAALMLHWYHLAAAHGYVGAENNLGFAYATGRPGLPRNTRIALEWFNDAVAKGNAAAQDSLGFMYFTGYGVEKDRARGLHLFELAANQGYARAQEHLGHAYQVGGGGDKPDYEKALHWYKLSADQDWSRAQYALGKMYELGLGTVQDYRAARAWYERAAQQGLGSADFALGELYEHGLGVPKDTATALHWYDLAVQNGDNDAKEAVKRLSATPSPSAHP